MRIASGLAVALFAALVAVPTGAKAQGNISIRFGTRLGPEVGVSAYSVDRMGDWRTNYRSWRPETLYDVNGRYYRQNVRGSRAVAVYSYNNEYFLPPEDQGFRGADRRYNNRRYPTAVDYGRTRPYEPYTNRPDRQMGDEIGVLGYSADRAGDWRRNARRWTPVTLYEVNGHYYPNNGAGARPVSMYRYKNEYFLPPTDQRWVGSDRRFNYNNQPNDQDRGRVRDRP